MAHFTAAALFRPVGEDGDLFPLALLEDTGVHRSAFDIRGAELEVLVVVERDHLVEGHGGLLGGIQLFDEEHISALHLVLLAAGFNNGVHTGTCLFLRLAAHGREKALFRQRKPLPPGTCGIRQYTTAFPVCQRVCAEIFPASGPLPCLRLFPEGGQPHTLPFHRPLSDFAAFVAGLHPVGKAPPVGGEKGGRHLDPGPFGGRREMRHLYPGTHGGDPFTEGWLYQPHAGVFHAGDERGRGENRHHPAAHLHREHLLCDRPFPFFLSANEFLHRPFPPFVYQDSVNFPFFSRGKEETMIKYDFAGRFTRNHLSAAVFIP